MGVFPCKKCGEPWLSFDAGESHVCNTLKARDLELQNQALQKVADAAADFYNARYIKSNEQTPDYWKTAARFDAVVKDHIEKQQCEHGWRDLEPVVHDGEQCWKCFKVRPKKPRSEACPGCLAEGQPHNRYCRLPKEGKPEGKCEGCGKPSSTVLCQPCFTSGDYQ